MSNDHHHISSLVTDLVEMAQATKRLPELEAELREAFRRIDQLVSRNTELERRIEQEVALNTELAGKLHAAEVARDDAGFRQLEAEDKATGLRRAVEDVLSSLGLSVAVTSGDNKPIVERMSEAELREYHEYLAAKDRAAAQQAEEAVDPTGAPESVVPSTGDTEGQRAADPTPATPYSPEQSTPATSAYSAERSSEGVSVQSDPTVPQPHGSSSETVLVDTVKPQDGAGIAGKYRGKRYADWPYYVSEDSWVAGGGTHESYVEGRH